MANSPSYSDVSNEEQKWLPEGIYKLYDNGMTKTQVAAELGTDPTTVIRHLRWRLEGKNPTKRLSTTKGRLEK